jgi:hypothetical protein
LTGIFFPSVQSGIAEIFFALVPEKCREKKYIQDSINGRIFLPDSYKIIEDKRIFHRHRLFSPGCFRKPGAK